MGGLPLWRIQAAGTVVKALCLSTGQGGSIHFVYWKGAIDRNNLFDASSGGLIK